MDRGDAEVGLALTNSVGVGEHSLEIPREFSSRVFEWLSCELRGDRDPEGVALGELGGAVLPSRRGAEGEPLFALVLHSLLLVWGPGRNEPQVAESALSGLGVDFALSAGEVGADGVW